MTDSHLNNTIKMLEKMAKRNRDLNLSAAYSCLASFDPDSMASFYCDQNINNMEEDIDGENFLPLIYEYLIEEKDKRERVKFNEEQEREIYDDCVINGCDKYGSIQDNY